MGKKLVLYGLLLLCSLALVAATAEAGGFEVWRAEVRVRSIGNFGDRGTETYEGWLDISVSGNVATHISCMWSMYGWSGTFAAASQPWRDNGIKANHVVFDGLTPAGGMVVGRLRPNKNWTKLTGKVIGADPAGGPSHSYYQEITVTAVYDHYQP